jgi:hypothetical protein
LQLTVADNRRTENENRRTFQKLLPKHPIADSVYSRTDYRLIVVMSVTSITVGLLNENPNAGWSDERGAEQIL